MDKNAVIKKIKNEIEINANKKESKGTQGKNMRMKKRKIIRT